MSAAYPSESGIIRMGPTKKTSSVAAGVAKHIDWEQAQGPSHQQSDGESTLRVAAQGGPAGLPSTKSAASKRALPFAQKVAAKLPKHRLIKRRMLPKHGLGATAAAQSLTTNVIRPLDIICGRGRPYQKHPGNIRFLAIVDAHRQVYNSADRRDKVAVAAEVVRIARSSKFGGYPEQMPSEQDTSFDSTLRTPNTGSVRFLRRVVKTRPGGSKVDEEDADDSDESLDDSDDNDDLKEGNDDNVWFEVSEEVALDKASHALRSKYRTIRYTADDVHAAVQTPSKHNKIDATQTRLSVDVPQSRPPIPVPPAPTSPPQQHPSGSNTVTASAGSRLASQAGPLTDTKRPTLAVGGIQATRFVGQSVLSRLQPGIFSALPSLDGQRRTVESIAQEILAEERALTILKASRERILVDLNCPFDGLIAAAAPAGMTPYPPASSMTAIQVSRPLIPSLMTNLHASSVLPVNRLMRTPLAFGVYGASAPSLNSPLIVPRLLDTGLHGALLRRIGAQAVPGRPYALGAVNYMGVQETPGTYRSMGLM